MKDEESDWTRGHREIVGVGVKHFQKIYKNTKRVNNLEVVKISSF